MKLKVINLFVLSFLFTVQNYFFYLSDSNQDLDSYIKFLNLILLNSLNNIPP